MPQAARLEVPDHGTRSRYQAGCRCTPCRAANAVYMAQLRGRKGAGLPPLGSLVSAKEAGAHVRALLVEQYRRRDILDRTGLERHILPKLNATAKCRLKTLLLLRRTYRILIADPTMNTLNIESDATRG